MDIPDYNYLEKFVIQDLKDSVNLETSIDFDVTEITEDWKLVNYTKDLVSIHLFFKKWRHQKRSLMCNCHAQKMLFVIPVKGYWN